MQSVVIQEIPAGIKEVEKLDTASERDSRLPCNSAIRSSRGLIAANLHTLAFPFDDGPVPVH